MNYYLWIWPFKLQFKQPTWAKNDAAQSTNAVTFHHVSEYADCPRTTFRQWCESWEKWPPLRRSSQLSWNLEEEEEKKLTNTVDCTSSYKLLAAFKFNPRCFLRKVSHLKTSPENVFIQTSRRSMRWHCKIWFHGLVCEIHAHNTELRKVRRGLLLALAQKASQIVAEKKNGTRRGIS